MNRQEFMNRLERLLWNVPENDRLDAITYYNDYFDEAGAENEAKVIEELGSPERVASMIQGASFEQEEKTKHVVAVPRRETPWLPIVILVIIGAPMLIGIAGGVLGGIVGLLGLAFGLLAAAFGGGVGLLVGGLICLIVGIIRTFASPLEGITCIGVGSLCAAFGLLFLVFFAWLAFKWIPAVAQGLVSACKKVYEYIKGRFFR